MEITFKSALPAENYAQPTIRYTFALKYKRSQEALTNISGRMSIHGKIISVLNLETSLPESVLRAVKYHGEQSELAEVQEEVVMVSVLDRRMVELIENSRRDNKKGDVEFVLNVSVNYLSNLAELSHVAALALNSVPFAKQTSGEVPKILGLDPQRHSVGLLFHAYQGRDYYQNNNNLMFIVENASAMGSNPRGGYLSTDTTNKEFSEKIHSSEWINDFAPVLGLGEFFVVEIPSGNKTLEAWNLLSKAEESYRRWNIDGVMSSCRKVGQNLDGLLKEKFGKESFSYKERWLRIYGNGKGGGFNFWSSMPLHTEDIKNKGTGGTKYEGSDVIASEADAEAVLLITKSLIKYAEKLASEDEKGEILKR